MMNMYETMSGWMGAWMWIPSVILVLLLVLLAVAMIRFMSTASTTHGGDEPLAIAGRRLARGEISKDEFEQLRAALGRP